METGTVPNKRILEKMEPRIFGNGRQKWLKERRSVAVGDIVIIAESSPRGQWPMARVIEVHKDAKGLVRSVKLKTKCASLVRPITKLVVLLEADK